MMQPTLLQSLDLSARRALPAALTLLLMLFALTPANGIWKITKPNGCLLYTSDAADE